MDSLSNNLQLNALQWQGQAQASKLQQLQKEYMNPESTDRKKLKKAAQEFESVFLNQMLEEMDKTIQRDENGILGGGSSEGYFRSMLNQEIARSMSTKTGGSGFGLAEAIYKQMAEHLDATKNEPSSTTKIQEQTGAGKTGEVKS
jgi:Rod binding domain-containing protein